MIVVSMWKKVHRDVGVRLLMLSGVVYVDGGRRVLYMKTNMHLWKYLAGIFLEWVTFYKIIAEELRINILAQ
jgi:hypothetical protein